MITINECQLQATNGQVFPLRSLAWSGLPILDVCAVSANYGHLLVLTTNGALHGVNFDTGTSSELCVVDLPDIPTGDDHPHFGAAAYRLHASADGAHAAIVVDKGENGIVVAVLSGAVTMRLHGGDYHADTVPFSACFLCFEGKNVLIHRSDWNRLDAADPATGESLTARHIAEYKESNGRPEHYLDYFHGQLRLSPDGSRIFDDGWVWHPVSIPRTWSVTDWLSTNPWESEDGASIVDLGTRDDWTRPACWVSERHIALWGLADWDKDELEETGNCAGVLIRDVTETEQTSDGLWPMNLDERSVLDLFSDGKRLFIAGGEGTTVWDLASRTEIAGFPDFTARLHDAERGTLLAFGPASIVELPIR